MIAGGSVGARLPDGQQHTWSAGPAFLSAEEVVAEVVALVILKPGRNQALFLALLHRMGRRYTGPSQGALPGWMIHPWALSQPPAVFSWDILGMIHLVHSATLCVAISSPVLPYTHINFLHHHISRPNNPSLLIHGFLTEKS